MTTSSQPTIIKVSLATLAANLGLRFSQAAQVFRVVWVYPNKQAVRATSSETLFLLWFGGPKNGPQINHLK